MQEAMRKETQAGGDLRVQGLAALFFSEAIIEDLNLKKESVARPRLSGVIAVPPTAAAIAASLAVAATSHTIMVTSLGAHRSCRSTSSSARRVQRIFMASVNNKLIYVERKKQRK